MAESRVLKDIFVAPPISVLDVKQKYWKDRKKYWLSLGIQSELGRDENLLSLSSLLQKKQKATSVFDPVLCEVMYLWFSKENDAIYDSFAGGSVRGIVASKSKRNYIGTDLRSEQVESNQQQAKKICSNFMPQWVCMDAAEYTPAEYDFYFTCPPYYDLEIYSDIPKDLSNMSSKEFDTVYESILSKHLMRLKNDRFAAIVLGDVRNENGYYRKFISKTIDIFEKNSCMFYNDLVLLQEPATAAMRAFNYMNSSRKIAKCHQNVLVFVKGSVEKAVSRLSRFDDTHNGLWKIEAE